MKVSQIDKMEELLNNANDIKNVVRYSVGTQTFKRFINFTVRGVEYKIEWYSNVSTVYAGNMAIRFTDIELSGTWPNGFKNNLQFYLNGEIVSILGVEEY